MARRWWRVLAAAAVVALGACADDGEGGAGGEPADPELRAELLEMLERDQAVRTDEPTDLSIDEVDAANQARISEVFDEHGWPGWELVGEDGSTAAWAIVQHADLDLDLQRRGLELLEAAVADGDASPGDLAYLVDRVRVAEGEPQVYGTQWGLGPDGEFGPQPIEDEADVDARRAQAGLGTMEEYRAELEGLDG